ncbi:Ger(x)C family spore germination protein [Paenibacillus agricola]|uniref:Ger(X)C family spore germination protein n=1 Tax=Paenibacillus agricola TaxID=2716264 RepID=A0ABX0J9D8_9BACL|nr:Ger(x)C family spore germination protein [Paenibacillus agricola]NHN32984.1 Ger(x)C family spore germination protein [Paenibacillus agricola]
MSTLKYSLILFVFLGMLLLCGCEFQDIDKRYFVMSIGIDSVPDKEKLISVSLKLAIPSPNSKQKQDEFEVSSAEGSTISEAIEKIKTKVSMELEFGQTKVIILGEELAKKDLFPTVDWLARNRAIQKIALVAIGKPNAKAILDIRPKSARLPGYNLYLSLSKSGTESNFITQVRLFDFYRKIYEKGWDPVLPIVTLQGNGFDINQTAVFAKKNILHTSLVLNPKNTEINNMISKNQPHIVFPIQREDLNFSVDLLSTRSRYSIKNVSAKPATLHITISGNGNIIESKSPLENKELRRYEKLAQEVIKERIESYLQVIQKANMDPVGFGLKYRSTSWRNDTKWEDWSQAYPTIPALVEVKLQLKNTEMIQ